MDDRWLSMKEICQYLGVSHDTISRWIKECEMPSDASWWPVEIQT